MPSSLVSSSDIWPGSFADTPEAYADISISDIVRLWAVKIPNNPAFITEHASVTWREYDALGDAVCEELRNAAGVQNDPVALLLPDTAAFHASLVGCWRATRIAAAIGARSGAREAAHIMRKTKSHVLVTTPVMRNRTWTELVAELQDHGAYLSQVVLVDEHSGDVALYRLNDECSESPREGSGHTHLRFRENDVTILNSTSGTTGLPKIVAHTERKWREFAALAMAGGRITADDVVLSAVPAPFGFGLWSAHSLPALLGAPAVVTARFDVEQMARLIERERVSVLCCVTTQFKMLLQSETAMSNNLGSLRVMYTGGERVGREHARAFEELTGAAVLQFYGSNEAGPVSATTLDDDAETRLVTCGRIVPSVNVRVIDSDGKVLRGSPRRGQVAVRGPLLSAGYWNDAAANETLFTADGWMRLGDIVEIDSEQRLRVVGRAADIIIRGGRNISVAEVEDLVRCHSVVDDAIVVPVPDKVFGERVCAVVVVKPREALDTASLAAALRSQGASPEQLPEYVVSVASMAMGAGGKVDRQAMRQRAIAAIDAEENSLMP